MTTSEIVSSPAAEPAAAKASDLQQASSTQVLITENQVVFSTAAAAASRPQHRLTAMLCRVFAISTTEARPPNPQRPKQYYLERARMGREMDRL